MLTKMQVFKHPHREVYPKQRVKTSYLLSIRLYIFVSGWNGGTYTNRKL